ncbi:MAG: ShlB/FhaC/HecB family hemolysin secretion/activation protein, partial [Oscillatoriales cyanobacterium SM2_1_8]|nr:ShlB/FhaC/HecB family hemolysin secretion/activation protein [Oscillatoriales cyanobacterium SM2_1_8]
LTYTVPINPQDGTLSLSFDSSNSRVIEAPFTPLDIVAAARSYELTWRQPLARQPDREWALGLTLNHRQSETELLATPFPLSPGADAEGRTRISAVRFFQEFSQRGPQTVWAGRSQFSLGLGVLGATLADEGPDSRFLTWRGQVQYANVLAPDALLLVRGDVQLADRPLVPIEQMGLGGRETVRGYRQDLLLTDNGLNASAEVRWPVLRVPESQGVLQVVPFLDFGTGWNVRGENPAINSLWGTGLGLRWQQGDRLTLRLEYGVPLSTPPADRRTLQEQGWYFSLRWQAF